MASLAAFDNEEWQAYLRTVEIPGGADSAIRKLKAKWYKRNVHPDFDISLVAPAPAAPTPPAEPSSRPTPQPTTAPRPTPPQPASQPSTGIPTLDLLRLCMMLTVPLWILPIFPAWGAQAFRACCWLGVVVHGARVLQTHGSPRLRPFPRALADWASRVTVTADGQYALQCLLFGSQAPQLLALLSPVTLAAYHVAVAARSRFGSTPLWQRHGARVYDLMSANRASAMQMCANSEIMLGIVLVLGILRGVRGMMLAYMWWTQLKIRFHSPDFLQQHRQVWQVWGTMAAPYLAKVPLLQRGVGYAQSWFANVQRR